jgi:hypothetical protein
MFIKNNMTNPFNGLGKCPKCLDMLCDCKEDNLRGMSFDEFKKSLCGDDRCLNSCTKSYDFGFEDGQEEYKHFILAILEGIDIADKEMENEMGGTRAIRLALKSRII